MTRRHRSSKNHEGRREGVASTASTILAPRIRELKPHEHVRDYTDRPITSDPVDVHDTNGDHDRPYANRKRPLWTNVAKRDSTLEHTTFRAGPPGAHGSSDSLRRPLPRTVYTPINHPPPALPSVPTSPPRQPLAVVVGCGELLGWDQYESNVAGLHLRGLTVLGVGAKGSWGDKSGFFSFLGLPLAFVSVSVLHGRPGYMVITVPWGVWSQRLLGRLNYQRE
ncbi:hypothetical protein WN48_08243 [Eufriesea mexicana]|nr:hypothetical protein WN48_08243 [Eufriesea mexicana]